MLAENIVNRYGISSLNSSGFFIRISFRAVDIERARQAEMKQQYEMVAKAALVNNIKVKLCREIFISYRNELSFRKHEDVVYNS